MAAPRKYTDEQREAIFRLHEADMSSTEIAEACADGRTGLAPFEISPRTVRDIIGKMEQEAQRKLPATVLDLEHGEAMERFPARAARILDAELDRLQEKQSKSGLTERDVDRIPRLVTSSAKVERALQERGKRRARSRGAGSGAGKAPESKSVLEKMAEEMAERKGGEGEPTSARTHREDGDSGVKSPDSPASAPPSTAPAGQNGDEPQAGADTAENVHTTPPLPPDRPVPPEVRERARAALRDLESG